jgi:hypothetical protein
MASCRAATEPGAGRDDPLCALSLSVSHRKVTAMSKFVAPLTFTIAAAWVVVLFVLVHSAP